MTAGVSDDARQLLRSLAGSAPEWRSWLRLLDETLRAIENPAWERYAPETDDRREPDAPLLHGASAPVDPQLAGEWVRRLLSVASAEGSPGAGQLHAAARSGELDALELIGASSSQDEPRLAALAMSAGAGSAVLGPLAGLAAAPLLQAFGRHLAGAVSSHWSNSYCPICGAWPTMAELRGLDRARRMRCSRCSGDWSLPSLHCPFCDNKHFRQLGSLVPDGDAESRKVDTCDACKGYMKAVTTFAPWRGYRVALEDLATVDLDIAAIDRGYARPAGPGYPVEVRLHEAEIPKRGLLRWRS